MRFTEYLNEFNSMVYDTSQEVVEQLAKILKTECGPMISFIRKHNFEKYFCRWTSDSPLSSDISNELIIKKTTRTNRQPKDTPLKIHKALDIVFKRRFGWKVRSEGVFALPTTPDGFNDKSWLFFPVGKLDYVWAHGIADLYLTWRDSYDAPISGSDFANSIIDKYTNKDLDKAFQSVGYEVSFRCKEYYLVNYNLRDKLFAVLGAS